MEKLDQKRVKKYLELLPREIKVRVIFNPGEGFTAEVLDFPGCITEADSIADLISMVNHVIATYLELPKKYFCLVGYLPSAEAIKEISRKIKRSNKKSTQVLFPLPLIGSNVYQLC
jgi:predicted RNase H-like HicB family nuclease